MTGEQILALEPGPELNRLVGKLMGVPDGAECPDFSRDIAHAWKVAEWCAKNNPSVEDTGIDGTPYFEIGAGFDNEWYAVWVCRENDIDGIRERCFMHAIRPTVMHAICLAALLRFHEVYE